MRRSRHVTVLDYRRCNEKKRKKKEKTLDEMTVVELRVIAKDLGIKSYSKMNKADLIKAIKDAQTKQEQAETETEEPSTSTGAEKGNTTAKPEAPAGKV